MKDALTAALAGTAAVVFARDAADVALLRAAADTSAMVLLVLAPIVPNLDKAMLLAAVGALAVELAPHTRIAALDLHEGADPTDVTAAAMFLAKAESTTGQILRITAR